MSGPPLEIAALQEDGRLKLRVGGEIDLGTSPALERALDAPSRPTRDVVVDLTEVTFLDSSALKTLVQSQRRLGDLGIGMTLVAPPGSPAGRILALTHLTTTFRITDDRV